MPVDQGNGGQLVYTASRLKTTAAIDANCGLKKATAMCTVSGTKMTMNATTGAQDDQENPGHEEEDQLRELSELIEQVKQFDEKNQENWKLEESSISSFLELESMYSLEEKIDTVERFLRVYPAPSRDVLLSVTR